MTVVALKLLLAPFFGGCFLARRPTLGSPSGRDPRRTAHRGRPDLADLVFGSWQSGVLALLRGVVPGLDGFAMFCFLVAVLINRLSALAAFGIATAAAVIFAIFLAARGAGSN
jgi:hypothetical protein